MLEEYYGYNERQIVGKGQKRSLKRTQLSEQRLSCKRNKSKSAGTGTMLQKLKDKYNNIKDRKTQNRPTNRIRIGSKYNKEGQQMNKLSQNKYSALPKQTSLPNLMKQIGSKCDVLEINQKERVIQKNQQNQAFRTYQKLNAIKQPEYQYKNEPQQDQYKNQIRRQQKNQSHLYPQKQRKSVFQNEPQKQSNQKYQNQKKSKSKFDSESQIQRLPNYQKNPEYKQFNYQSSSQIQKLSKIQSQNKPTNKQNYLSQNKLQKQSNFYNDQSRKQQAYQYQNQLQNQFEKKHYGLKQSNYEYQRQLQKQTTARKYNKPSIIRVSSKKDIEKCQKNSIIKNDKNKNEYVQRQEEVSLNDYSRLKNNFDPTLAMQTVHKPMQQHQSSLNLHYEQNNNYPYQRNANPISSNLSNNFQDTQQRIKENQHNNQLQNLSQSVRNSIKSSLGGGISNMMLQSKQNINNYVSIPSQNKLQQKQRYQQGKIISHPNFIQIKKQTHEHKNHNQIPTQSVYHSKIKIKNKPTIIRVRKLDDSHTKSNKSNIHVVQRKSTSIIEHDENANAFLQLNSVQNTNIKEFKNRNTKAQEKMNFNHQQYGTRYNQYTNNDKQSNINEQYYDNNNENKNGNLNKNKNKNNINYNNQFISLQTQQNNQNDHSNYPYQKYNKEIQIKPKIIVTQIAKIHTQRRRPQSKKRSNDQTSNPNESIKSSNILDEDDQNSHDRLRVQSRKSIKKNIPSKFIYVPPPSDQKAKSNQKLKRGNGQDALFILDNPDEKQQEEQVIIKNKKINTVKNDIEVVMKRQQQVMSQRQDSFRTNFSQEELCIIAKVQCHLYLLNFIVELVQMVDDVYHEKNQQVNFSSFLILSKYYLQRHRVSQALLKGVNCFNLSQCPITQQQIDTLMSNPKSKQLINDTDQINSRAWVCLQNFYFFLRENYPQFCQKSQITLQLFNDDHSLPLLFHLISVQIEILLQKRRSSSVQQNDHQILNYRIFRLMEVQFLLSELKGSPVKKFQQDIDINSFEQYLSQNQQTFRKNVQKNKQNSVEKI